MQLKDSRIQKYASLRIIARQIVEGFVSGMHKSPLHGFSSEFMEHRAYQHGESVKQIDWKLYARTDRFFVRKYEDETNLRCHILVDNSGSMHYPQQKNHSLENLNKFSFSVYAAAALIELMYKQRDAVGLTIYSDGLEFFAQEKNNSKHNQILIQQLEQKLHQSNHKKTETAIILNDLAEKLHRKSMVILFTDLLQNEINEDGNLLDAIKHLKYNKHQLVLFHLNHAPTELQFNFKNEALLMEDMETKKQLKVDVEAAREVFQETAEKNKKNFQLQCAKYKIDYIDADITQGFDSILYTYLAARRK